MNSLYRFCVFRSRLQRAGSSILLLMQSSLSCFASQLPELIQDSTTFCIANKDSRQGNTPIGCKNISAKSRKKECNLFKQTHDATSYQVLHFEPSISRIMFHVGQGNTTYNDCVQCLMMMGPGRPECSHQMFVNATNYNLGFSCSPLAKEVLLRGFYGAELAWWFTLFPPSQFIIFNSEQFFRVRVLFMVHL